MKHYTLILLLLGCGSNVTATADLDLDAGVAVTASEDDDRILGLFGGAGTGAPEDATVALDDAGAEEPEPIEPIEPEDAGVDATTPPFPPEDGGLDASVVVLGETCDPCSSDDDCESGYACIWRDTDSAKLCFWLPTPEVSCFARGGGTYAPDGITITSQSTLVGTYTAVDPTYCQPKGNFVTCETWRAMQ